LFELLAITFLKAIFRSLLNHVANFQWCCSISERLPVVRLRRAIITMEIIVPKNYRLRSTVRYNTDDIAVAVTSQKRYK